MGSPAIAHSIKSRLRRAGSIGLPYKRNIYRFVPPKHYNPANPLPRKGAGFVDRFGNVWQEGSAHGLAAANGDAAEWDVQLSATAHAAWFAYAKTVNGVSYVNVTRDGMLSH